MMTNKPDGNEMPEKTTLTVRLGGALGEYVTSNIGDNGSYENVSEYIRDLIRRDKQRKEEENFERLRAELSLAFQQPDESYRPLTSAEVIRRNQPAK
ncbi:MAG: addiction module antitoxin [Wenzhouxiangellaceae bacterium]